jgi:hypothetical protein
MSLVQTLDGTLRVLSKNGHRPLGAGNLRGRANDAFARRASSYRPELSSPSPSRGFQADPGLEHYYRL